MEQTKQDLTILITRINGEFPEGNDLKGFLGISKELITDTLLQSDALLISLKEYDSNFSVIVLKRELAELFEKIRNDLDEKFDNLTSDKFQSILTRITKIIFLIKETYISVASNAVIRTEAEIARAKEELALLSSNNEELKKINAELLALKDTTIQNITALTKEATSSKDETLAISEEAKGLKESAAAIISDFEAKQKNAIDNETKIVEFLKTIETHKTAVETIHKNVTDWEIEINAAKELLTSKVSEFNNLNNKSKTLDKEIESTHEKIFGKKDADGKLMKGYLQETEDLKTKIADFLNDQQTKYSAQFKEIEGLLPGATSAGLAEAYQIQKRSYKNPILLWSGVFITTITAMTGLSIYLI